MLIAIEAFKVQHDPVVLISQRRLIGGAPDGSALIGRPRLTGNPNVKTCAQFGHGLSVNEGITDADIEREIVTHLPDGSDQGGKCLRLVYDAVGVKFKNRSDLPFARSFDDGVQ